MTIGELVFTVLFKADTMKLKDFSKAVGELNLESIIAASGFGAVYEAAKKIVSITDDASLAISKFGRETGQSTQEIQQWNMAAEQMGVHSGTIAGAVSTLEDSLFRMKLTGENSNIWNMLQIDPTHTQNMFQVLTMLRERFKGMSTEMQRFYLERLGLSTELLNVFKETDAEWANSLNIQTQSNEQLKTATEFHKDMVRLGQQLNKLWGNLGGVLMVPLDLLFKFLSMILGIVNGILSFPVWIFQIISNIILEIIDYLDNVLSTTSALRALWRDISSIISGIANFFKAIEESIVRIISKLNIFKAPSLSPTSQETSAPSLSPMASLLKEKLKGLSAEQQKVNLEKFNIPTDQWDKLLGKQKNVNQELEEMHERQKHIVSLGQMMNETFKNMGNSLSPILAGLKSTVGSFGTSITKSFGLRNLLNGINSITGDVLNPFKSLQVGLGGLSNIVPHHSIFSVAPENSKFSPENLTPIMQSSTASGSPKVTVNVKSTIKSNDPNTTVETTSDHDSLKHTVRNIVNQKPAGST